MHTHKFIAGLCVGIAAIVLAPTQVLAQSLLVDDFSTGAYQVDAYAGSPDLHYSSGTMLGGVRGTYVLAAPELPLHQRPASLSIPPGGPLILETGFQVNHRLELVYGRDAAGNQAPLNLDTRSYDRIRVWFDGCDVSENFNIVLFAAGGRHYSLGINTTPEHRPFCIDFPLGKFLIPEADRADIDFIALILQTGSAMGATDFALRSVSLLGPADIGWASCWVAP
ncbi:hypothetical protein HPC49_41530 [Pyxidicoccus fallax]|uniref:Uncharacterized protein n=1 Tax=Pyxidicoccus fallax TaxID=394095 RepID=A0A848LS78_9BACT|nr:hypothetical protein [Pyxidicoccus fallax]NMO20383.1 hypothetical protein [Pyxidicoccus fallax]NPC84686.1 hypothetical protein [Pyxidicoccus fallax]